MWEPYLKTWDLNTTFSQHSVRFREYIQYIQPTLSRVCVCVCVCVVYVCVVCVCVCVMCVCVCYVCVCVQVKIWTTS